MGARPDFKIYVKSKREQGAKRLPLLAAWKSERGIGFNAKLEKGVSLTLADGTVVTSETHYVDMFDNRESPPAASSDDDDIAF